MCRDLLAEEMQKSWDAMNRQRGEDEARIRDEEEAKKVAAIKAEARAEIVAKLRERAAKDRRLAQPDELAPRNAPLLPALVAAAEADERVASWIEAGCPS